ncbi:MAG TPA: cysteine desulfurase-like protein [Bacteroidota bacterium]|nr:cysteine desulfurase-like protein [Bacteroidota bacterium]
MHPLQHSPRAFSQRRNDFPSLLRTHNGHTLVYFDGPGGTQVPQAVIDAIAGYYTTCNSNTHGSFVTTRESDKLLAETRSAIATYLGARGPQCISLGANMTTLNFALSHALRRSFKPGDEVLITQLDHEANRGPWLGLKEHGIVIREVVLKRDGTLDYDDMRAKIGPKTRLLAIGMASNALGTVNNIALARELTSRSGALLMVDAVHYAPHFPIDVGLLGVDFLICSAYKFYGPHVGILYAKEGLLDSLEPDRLRTQDQSAPYRIETGTLNHAAIVGIRAAIDYLASFGSGNDLRSRIVSAMDLIGGHERTLAASLYDGLRSIPGISIYGPPFGDGQRAPTVSFTLGSRRAEDVCGQLGDRGFCTWDGHFYAVRAIEILGLLERGGVTRIGISMYNTDEEVSHLLDELMKIASH